MLHLVRRDASIWRVCTRSASGVRLRVLQREARMKRLSFALLAGLVLSAQGCTDASAPGVSSRSFDLEGITRSYLFHKPSAQQDYEGKRPLVLVLHGGGESAESMVAFTRSRFNALADEHGFYVVYANSADGQWDLGEGTSSDELSRRVDDFAYFDHVLNDMVASEAVDAGRIFATGHSRGGMASYFLACKMPGRFRAIAPVSMSLPVFLEDDCAAPPAFGFALINGTADPFMPYSGGHIVAFGKKRDAILSTAETLEIMRARNGCAEAPDNTGKIDKPGDETSITRNEWTSCTGAPVVEYRIENGGHTWPSGTQLLPVDVIGEVSHDIDGADEIWTFFSHFE